MIRKCFVVGPALLVSMFGANAAFAQSTPMSIPGVSLEVGARYFYSTGKSNYDLYGDRSTANRVSAIQYQDDDAHSGEVYFRADHTSGFFLKGFGGLGSIVNGTGYDEDFPPDTDPYSRTVDKAEGDIEYLTIDFGYTFLDTARNGSTLPFRLGGFVGYNYWNQRFEAYGCTQLATNANCSPGDVAPDAHSLTQEDWFHNLRIGAVADIMLSDQWKLTGEAAYVLVDHKDLDQHPLRPDLTDTYARSGGFDGNGVQLEAVLSYQVTPEFNVGVGGRWWYTDTEIYLDPGNQLEEYQVHRYGVFVQGGYKFN